MITGAVGLLGAVIGALGAWLAMKTQTKEARRANAIDFARQQLNEYYGPLLTLRATSKRLREGLPPDAAGEVWNLVDHIEELHDGANEVWRDTAEQIINIGQRVAEILETRAGYADSLPAPDSFVTFLSHQRLLQMHWKSKTNPPPEGRIPFPKDFDRDLRKSYDGLEKRLAELLKSS